LPVILPETIVRRRCAALIPYAGNARTHSDQQVAQIVASIGEFGFTNPVLIDQEDGIIAGHGRVLAAHLLGLGEVPCKHCGTELDTDEVRTPTPGSDRSNDEQPPPVAGDLREAER
jgi:hypothetical protein